ncbi:MAG: aldehyde dehydrogenase family protein [Acidobacteria bacterium]|nr:aldehyde dehydrogenase family protein [Acidobacteriota bacterium]
MDMQLQSIVGNQDVAGPGSIVSIDPATEEEIAAVPALDAEGAVRAVEAAAEAFPAWSHTSFAQRQRLLARWLALIVAHEKRLAELVSLEGGKPVLEARLVDVFPACETLSFMARKLHRMLGFRPVSPRQILFSHWKAGYRYDPLGVVAIITPWNYPVGIPMAEIVPAVAAGNTVVFKPASATVLTGLMLADLARRAGFPPGVINAVALPGSATNALLDHPGVAKVLFTGSVDIGRHVARRCAERLAPCQLELGGKDAAVVAADANLERTARGLVWGAFMNSGQTCASIERAYVEAPLFDSLVERIVELTRELVTGDPRHPGTDLGPLTTRGQRDIVAGQVERALAGGARALTGGRAPDGRGFFYPPTVLVDVTDEMDVMTEETFGPVLPIVKVASIDEGIARANASRFGLTASGWTRSKDTAALLQRELSAGVVTINEHVVSFAEATATWGGVRESGIGRSHGEVGLHELVNVKYVARDPGRRQAAPWHYPYDEDLGRFMEAAIPALYHRGWQRIRGLLALMATRRFRQRALSPSLIAHLYKLV